MPSFTSLCQSCRKRQADLGCVLCRRDMCRECFEEHMLRISAGMDEGFSALGHDPAPDDQDLLCEVCGMRVESEKKDEHLFEQHGISV
jgi:hypothetical protein